MISTPNFCILPHPLLRPEILEWDVRHKHRIPEHRRQRYNQAATTPPTESMTLMIPGFKQHLPPIELQHLDSLFITVAQVFRHIRRHLYMYELSRGERSLHGRQRVVAETSCLARLKKKKKLAGPFDEEFYSANMRGIDLVCGRTHFGGLVHQLDAQGANVWVVALENSPTVQTVDKIHPILSPGYFPWDMADPPLKVFAQVYGPDSKDVSEDKVIATKLRPVSISLTDISASWAIEIPTGMLWDIPRDPMSVGEVLKAIHEAMNMRYSEREWAWWDPDAAAVAKAVYDEVRVAGVLMGGYPVASGSDDTTTFLDTTPPAQQRFLGIWDEVDRRDRRYYTLLTQPSLRPTPTLHCSLHDGMLHWDIITPPIAFEEMPGFDAPATFPGRRSMSLKIDFMPGESWSIDLFKPRKAPFVTVGQVLFMIHEHLVVDAFRIAFARLPPYLMYEVRTRAEMRYNWNIVDGYKRVDTLRGAFCTGLEHRIGALGEDEWQVCLGRPD